MSTDRKLAVVTNELPEPPYPPDTKAGSWRPTLDIQRIDQSDTWTLADNDERAWLLRIWYEAWRSIPVGSMPCDRAIFARRIGLSLPYLETHSVVLLRGWVRHADDRLYHPFITEMVLGLMGTRRSISDRQARYREANRKRREEGVTRYSRVTNGNQGVSNNGSPERGGDGPSTDPSKGGVGGSEATGGEPAHAVENPPEPASERVCNALLPVTNCESGVSNGGNLLKKKIYTHREVVDMEGGVGETISNPPAKKPSKGSRAKPKTSLPDDFGISERVRRWATDKGVIDLEAHHESFCLRARARGYTYSDWDAALMTAIRDDWAGLARGRPARYQQRQQQSLTDTMDDWLAIYGSGLPEVEGEGEFIDGEATNVRH